MVQAFSVKYGAANFRDWFCICNVSSMALVQFQTVGIGFLLAQNLNWGEVCLYQNENFDHNLSEATS